MMRAARWMATAWFILVGVLLAWEFVDGFPRWSNGWMEGLSYAAGACAFVVIAALLLGGSNRHPLLYWSCGSLLFVLGLWCTRWAKSLHLCAGAWWLFTVAPQIGPVLPVVPWALALGALLCFVAAAAVARQTRLTGSSHCSGHQEPL